MNLAAFRKHFARGGDLVHLNNAGLSPTSLPARDAVRHWVDRFAEEGMFSNDDYLAALEGARGSLARFLDAEPGSIAFFQSTAGAVGQVAFSLGLAPGDEVVTWDQEYGSNLHPWRAACERAGARLVLVPSGKDLSTPYERILDAIGARTRAVGISWVQYQTGAITALEPIIAEARARGIWTVFDVIQGAGALPLSFRKLGADAICGGSHKWMASPVGVGYLAIRPERCLSLEPRSVGALTYGSCDDPASLHCEPKRDARRFEAGSKQVLEIIALGASAGLLAETGMLAISSEVLRLADRLSGGLRRLGYEIAEPNGPTPASGIVTFSPGERSPRRSVEDAARSLVDHRISFALRGPGIRLSPHAHNAEEDVARALEVLEGG